MLDRVKGLIQDRTNLAIKKELTKKMIVICGAFGRPVVEHMKPYTLLPDYWEIEAPDIPEITDDHIVVRGCYFDGLNRGMDINIRIISYDTQISEISCNYKGARVYTETEGELKSYVPSPIWEDLLERLYIYAKPTHEEKDKLEKLKKKEANKSEVMNLLDKLRVLWGIKIK